MAMNPRLLRPTSSFSPKSISGLALWLDGSDASSLYTTDAGPVEAVSSPLDISGCVGWWDASDASTLFEANTGDTLATTTVGRWANKVSGGPDATQATLGSRPSTTTVNGKTALLFDGTDDWLTFSGTARTDETWIVVFRQASAQANVKGVITDGASGFGLTVTTTPTLRVLDSSWGAFVVGTNRIRPQLVSDTTTPMEPAIVSIPRSAASGGALFLNGTRRPDFSNSSITSFSTSLSATLSSIAGIGSSAGYYLDGWIAEIIVYDTALSTSQRASVERYLAAKWGISGVHAPAVTASDPVGYWRDRSGNNRHATQATAASRPVVGSQNGRKALTANGTSHELSLANAVGIPRNKDGLTIIAALTPNTVSSIRTAAFWSVGTSTGARSLLQFNAAELRAGGRRLDADSFDSATGGTVTASQPIVAVARLDYANAIATAYGNSAIFANDSSFLAAGSVSDTDSQVAFAMSSGGQLYYSGTFAELLVYDRALTSSERRRVETYLARRWGITLAPQVSNAEAQDWISRVYAAGSTVSQSVANSVDAFVTGCKADGIWDAMKSVVLLAGADTLAGAIVPLKGAAPTSYNFASGDYSKTSGLVGNGSDKWLNSNRNENADGIDDNHLAFYASTVGTGLLGGSVSFLSTSFSNGATRNRNGTADAFTAVAGFLGMSRSSSADYVRRNGGADTTVTRASSTDAANAIGIFANNGNFSNHRIAFYSIGEALDLSALDSRVSALMSAIGVS